MAQTVYIAATTAIALSDTITLTEGQTISVHPTIDLQGTEQVILRQSSDDGSSFRKITGEINNNGVLLDQYTNRNTITGPGIFKIRKSETSASIGVKGG